MQQQNSSKLTNHSVGRNPSKVWADHPANTYLSNEKSHSKMSNKSNKGLPFRTKMRSNRRSKMALRNDSHSLDNSPIRNNPQIRTDTIHYNPTGPGDYEVPSVFGKLPAPRKRKRNASGFTGSYQGNDKQLVKNNPSFSIAHRIENSRVFKNNMNNFLGVDTPGIG